MTTETNSSRPAAALRQQPPPRTGPLRLATLLVFGVCVLILGFKLARSASPESLPSSLLGRLFSARRAQKVIVSGRFPELLENAEVKFHGLVIGHVESYTYNDEATRFVYTLTLDDCQINRAWVFTQATVEQSPPVVGTRWLEMADDGKQRLRPSGVAADHPSSASASRPIPSLPDIAIQAPQDWLAVLQSPQGMRDFLWSSLPASDRANLAEATGKLRAAADDLSEVTRDFKTNGLASERIQPTLQPLLTQANAGLADLDSPHFKDTYDHLLANVRFTSDNYAKVLSGYGDLANDLSGASRTKKTDLGRLVANAAESSAQLTATMQKLTPQLEALSDHLNVLISSYGQMADSINRRGVWSWVFPNHPAPTPTATTPVTNAPHRAVGARSTHRNRPGEISSGQDGSTGNR